METGWRVEQRFGRGREQLPELQQRREGWRKYDERERKKGKREKAFVKMERRLKKSLKNGPVKIFLFNEELQ